LQNGYALGYKLARVFRDLEITLSRRSCNPGGGMMVRCPYCGDEYYGLHFCPSKPVGVTVTGAMVRKIMEWWSKKFRGTPWSDKK